MNNELQNLIDFYLYSLLLLQHFAKIINEEPFKDDSLSFVNIIDIGFDIKFSVTV